MALSALVIRTDAAGRDHVAAVASIKKTRGDESGPIRFKPDAKISGVCSTVSASNGVCRANWVSLNGLSGQRTRLEL